jgi:pimeloyl-ACP methyl ester carboxylesterase
MIDRSRLIFIHGSTGDKSKTYKAILLKSKFPGILTPDFEGDLFTRMSQLETIIGKDDGWKIIGSSLGGLMGALFACQHPKQVDKLILLAPALTLPEFSTKLAEPVEVPTILILGNRDELLPPRSIQAIAEKVFPNLTVILSDDDHRLHKTADELNWSAMLE